MSSAHKAGIVGGAVVALGIGARSFDDCARAGGRVAHTVDDGAVRSVGLLDEAGHARPGALAEVGHLRGGGVVDEAAVGTPGSHWTGHAADLGLDVQLEILQAVGDDGDGGDAAPTKVKCPRVVAISRDAGAWTELMAGFGIACAPLVLVGTLDDTGTRVAIEGVATPIGSVIETCRTTGAHCLLAGCPSTDTASCEGAVVDALLATRLQPELVDYERAVATDLLHRESGPRLLAQYVVRDDEARIAIVRRAK